MRHREKTYRIDESLWLIKPFTAAENKKLLESVRRLELRYGIKKPDFVHGIKYPKKQGLHADDEQTS